MCVIKTEKASYLAHVCYLSMSFFIWSFSMKIGVMVLNAMFFLLFVSALIAEWGKAPAVMAGIGIVSLVYNSVFIMLRTKGDFEP